MRRIKHILIMLLASYCMPLCAKPTSFVGEPSAHALFSVITKTNDSNVEFVARAIQQKVENFLLNNSSFAAETRLFISSLEPLINNNTAQASPYLLAAVSESNNLTYTVDLASKTQTKQVQGLLQDQTPIPLLAASTKSTDVAARTTIKDNPTQSDNLIATAAAENLQTTIAATTIIAQTADQEDNVIANKSTRNMEGKTKKSHQIKYTYKNNDFANEFRLGFSVTQNKLDLNEFNGGNVFRKEPVGANPFISYHFAEHLFAELGYHGVVTKNKNVEIPVNGMYLNFTNRNAGKLYVSTKIKFKMPYFGLGIEGSPPGLANTRLQALVGVAAFKFTASSWTTRYDDTFYNAADIEESTMHLEKKKIIPMLKVVMQQKITNTNFGVQASAAIFKTRGIDVNVRAGAPWDTAKSTIGNNYSFGVGVFYSF